MKKAVSSTKTQLKT